MTKVPYFSQWESMHLAPGFLDRSVALTDDPLWETSGAASKEEYARWANHICGMACLKMILATKPGIIYPTLVLARIATQYGAYRVQGDEIKGMIYAPFVTMLAEKFNLFSRVMTNFPARDIAPHVTRNTLFIASVHPSIRQQQAQPPAKGGHLVLITHADEDNIVFHNPSGDSENSRANVTMPCDRFARFYAERGVLVSL